jgi:glycosyltransferase involved in cell wall biosynthesis
MSVIPTGRPGLSGVVPGSPVSVPDTSLLTGLTVLVIGINYWPEVTGIGPYTTAMAEELVRCGSLVTVLAGVPHYPSWRIGRDFRFRRRTRQRHNGVDLWRLRHHVPRKQSAVRRAVYEGTFLGQTLTARLAAPPDLVLAVAPSLGAAVSGARLARKYDVPVAMVVQDVVGHAASQSGIAGGSRVARATAALESWALRQASVIGVVSESFRPVLAKYGVPGDRIMSLPNWSHVPDSTGDVRAIRRRLGWPDGVTIALHSGNMGLKQDLGNIIDAARLTADRDDVRFVLMGDGSQRQTLETAARRLPNVGFGELVPDEMYLDVLRAADVLLLNERSSVTDMSLPSKLTSYLRAGRPIVAATAPHGATALELSRSGAAVLVPAGEPRRLAEAVLSVADAGPDFADDLGRAAVAYADRHLGEEAAMGRVRGLVLRALGADGPPAELHPNLPPDLPPDLTARLAAQQADISLAPEISREPSTAIKGTAQ